MVLVLPRRRRVHISGGNGVFTREPRCCGYSPAGGGRSTTRHLACTNICLLSQFSLCLCDCKLAKSTPILARPLTTRSSGPGTIKCQAQACGSRPLNGSVRRPWVSSAVQSGHESHCSAYRAVSVLLFLPRRAPNARSRRVRGRGGQVLA